VQFSHLSKAVKKVEKKKRKWRYSVGTSVYQRSKRLCFLSDGPGEDNIVPLTARGSEKLGVSSSIIGRQK
jgi:hypothetical protein